MPEPFYGTDEMMIVAAARRLRGPVYCFVGIGLPSAAANLARRTHAPDCVLVYESGVIGAKPSVLPLSIGDGDLGATADAIVPLPEIFAYWLQSGRIDVGFLGAAQIDRFGNINTTVIGPYDRPHTRLPGAGGAPEIAASAREVIVVLRQSTRTFVGRLDFVTSMGHLTGYDARERLGVLGRGPTTVITDLGILVPDPATKELSLTALHPGATIEAARQATGWPLRLARDLGVEPAPSALELEVLRGIQPRDAIARSA